MDTLVAPPRSLSRLPQRGELVFSCHSGPGSLAAASGQGSEGEAKEVYLVRPYDPSWPRPSGTMLLTTAQQALEKFEKKSLGSGGSLLDVPHEVPINYLLECYGAKDEAAYQRVLEYRNYGLKRQADKGVFVGLMATLATSEVAAAAAIGTGLAGVSLGASIAAPILVTAGSFAARWAQVHHKLKYLGKLSYTVLEMTLSNLDWRDTPSPACRRLAKDCMKELAAMGVFGPSSKVPAYRARSVRFVPTRAQLMGRLPISQGKAKRLSSLLHYLLTERRQLEIKRQVETMPVNQPALFLFDARKDSYEKISCSQKEAFEYRDQHAMREFLDLLSSLLHSARENGREDPARTLLWLYSKEFLAVKESYEKEGGLHNSATSLGSMLAEAEKWRKILTQKEVLLGAAREDFACPLTLERMKEPVSVPCCQQNFEKEAIENWMALKTGGQEGGEAPCPCCRAPLSFSHIKPSGMEYEKVYNMWQEAKGGPS